MLLEALLAGERVLLVTDAGMPSVSDPGYRLVAAAVEARRPRHRGARARRRCSPRWPSPGCRSTGSASRASCRARRASGPAGWPALAARGAHDGLLRGAAPHRGRAGRDGRGARAATAPAAVCRELTKTHEEVRRGPLADLVAWAAEGVRGEVTIVVAGAAPRRRRRPATRRACGPPSPSSRPAGTSRKEAIVEVARRAGRAQARGLQPGARGTTT